VRHYLAIEEFTVLSQIQNWTMHTDYSLSDLARRFLERERFAMVEAPTFDSPFAPDIDGWETALFDLVRGRVEYAPVEMYCLRDRVQAKYHQPYFPEKESDEQSVKNAIRVIVEGETKPVEVSKLRPRLRPLTEVPVDSTRYYIPKDVKADANRLREKWSTKGRTSGVGPGNEPKDAHFAGCDLAEECLSRSHNLHQSTLHALSKRFVRLGLSPIVTHPVHKHVPGNPQQGRHRRIPRPRRRLLGSQIKRHGH
jgi:hypothetical protein